MLIQDYEIDDGVAEAIAAFRLPDALGFGTVPAPVMFSARFSDEIGWRPGTLLPYGPIEILPNARALQFAEQIFEGMKAYQVGRNAPNFFRPQDNWARFRMSAERLHMPPVPEELFMQGISAVAWACRQHMPGDSGSSLYLRPCLFGTEASYSVRSSNQFCFMVLGSPSQKYSAGAMQVRIERTDVRAARHGLGRVKAGANYAASLRATTEAIRSGYTIALWLDPENRRHVEELSGMNLFAVIDGALHTPKLSDSILAGITRDSTLKLAGHLGYDHIERDIPIDELLEDIEKGRCTELFACGTAAIVSPIAVLGDADGREYRLVAVDDVAKRLREALLAIQERRAEDPFGWVAVVEPAQSTSI